MDAVIRKQTPVLWNKVRIEDSFWRKRQKVNRRVTLPLEYRVNRKNGVIKAYQWKWWNPARGNPPFKLCVGDLGKWLEAAAYSLGTRPDPALARLTEYAICEVLKGQKEDGYLYANPLRRDQRWANLQEYHELYDGGHMIEAAVAHFLATGRRHLLDAMCRYADLLDKTFGRGHGKIRGYDGHPEIELALIKLYRATGERRYLRLAKFFVDERGRQPLYFEREAGQLKRRGLPLFGWYRPPDRPPDYAACQAHQPVRAQKEAVGHAVRAMYLYAAAADVAAETGDAGLLAVCRRLWRNTTRRRMYVTGGVGSTGHGEAFGMDYDLPNETAYAETCASVALVLFAHRMLMIEARAEYADVMERVLFNGMLSGVALDGRKFFYVNRLGMNPLLLKKSPARTCTLASRQPWFSCACCPPNVARLLASLGQYVYSTSPQGLYVHLYAGSRAVCEVGGQRVVLEQTTAYPWQGKVALVLKPEKAIRFALALRIPGWCRGAALNVNGKPVRIAPLMRHGYAFLRRRWRPGDRVELRMPTPVERIEAHPEVWMNCGKVALQRGPLVYCLEEADNGPRLDDIVLPPTARLRAVYCRDLLGGAVVLRGKARQRVAAGWGDRLYSATQTRTRKVGITAVPYALWANRKPGEMQVWIRSG